jgi:CubicO group peptidase (beta-lactamase class C family)
MRFTLILLVSCWAAACAVPSSDETRPHSAESGDEGEGLGEPSDRDDLNGILEPIRASHDIPSLALLMWKGGSVVAEGAVGLRAIGFPDAVTVDDRWHLGSCTKAMTATLGAMLIEDGLLDWGTPVDDILPDANIDPGFSGVTLEELLGNHGGMPEEIPTDAWLALADASVTPMAHRARFARERLAAPPAVSRGTFMYSNAGFMVAGAMMEEVTGTAWEDLLRARLFTPLAMDSCGFGAPGTAGLIDEPLGHVVNGITTTPVPPGPDADNPPALGPAGTVHCSLEDWGRFIQLHIDGGRGVSSPLLSADSVARLHTPGDGDYALGWGVYERDWGGTVLNHSGSNTLWGVTVWVAPEHDAAMLGATNIGIDDGFLAMDEAFGPLIVSYFDE